MRGDNYNLIILASGYSVKAQGVDVNALKDRAYTIGVNDSGVRADVHAIVSMDRLWMENRIGMLRGLRKTTFLRESAYRVNLKDGEKWPGLYTFYCDHESDEMSGDDDTLNGFNSGVCALNLAYQIDPTNLYLFGFDMARLGPQPYWHDPYEWPQAKPEGNTGDGTYRTWAQRFDRIADQFKAADINVFNVSPDSAIPNFPKITYQEFLRQCAK